MWRDDSSLFSLKPHSARLPKMRPADKLAAKSKPKVKIRAAFDARAGRILALVAAVVLVAGQPSGAQQQSATSELSFEYLSLLQVPSDQLCELQWRNQTVNSLSLASNRIEFIESGAFACVASRLKILSLRNNKIELISDEAFKGLGQLQVLLLDGNQLKRLPSKQLAASSLPALHHLNLAHNKISSIESADSLSGLNLISLNLRGNPVEFFDANALSGLAHLKTLILSEFALKTNHFGRLDGLAELSFVHFDELGAHLNSIDDQLCHSSRKLATLSLKWNQFELVPRLSSCQGLLSLDLSYNKIKGRLEGNFSHLTNLIDLYLGHNQLEYLEASAFVGMSRLQVLGLNSNKIKRIHPTTFIPIRETLYELDVANNVQLEELTANGLERLVSLKAYGNIQLRRLPDELPSVQLLALTFAYHCCDYCQEESSNYDVGHRPSESGPISTIGHRAASEPASVPGTSHQRREDAGENGSQQRPSRSLVARWFDSILSTLVQFWKRNESDNEVRPMPPEATANSRNMSELVIWRPAVGVTIQTARGRQRRDETRLGGEFNLVGDDSNHPDEYAGARLNLHPQRGRKAGPELSEMETCAMGANVIDELGRIRLAHANDFGAPFKIAKPISGRVDDVLRCDDHELSLEARAILVARELASRLLTTASGNGNDKRPVSLRPSKRDISRNEAGRRPPVKCLPQPNAFQPCRDLFDSIWLRTSIWLVFLFAFAGNILVIVVLSSVRPSSSTSALTSIMWFNAAQSKRHIDVPRFLVINLAVADLLMALYLGLLAFVDLSTLGEFRKHAIKWQYSTGCQLAGFLAVLSSELSVFILAVITLERNYAITNAVHLNRRLSLQKAIVIMFLGYVYALTMAILPLNGKINDYRKYSICLPLDFDANNLQSNSSLYLISLISINTLSFVLLLSCYLRMYWAIRGSQAWSTNDLKIAKRMSILVVTDFLCWSPIILVASFALCGRNLIGSEGLKVLVIFVLPLNSVANPFLYAITTKKFKRDLAALRKRLKLERSLELMTRLVQTAGCSRRDSPPGRHSNDLPNGFPYRVPNGGQQQKSQDNKAKRITTGCRLTLDDTQAAVSSKIQRARRELLLVNENGHSMLAQGTQTMQQMQRRIKFKSSAADQRAPATTGACEKLTDLQIDRCAVCHSRLTVPNPIRGFESSDSSPELVTGRRSEEGRPKIVLDSVEPVLDVALAPLQLAAKSSPAQIERPQLLTLLQSARNDQDVSCRQTSETSEQEVQINRTRSNIMNDRQVGSNFLLPTVGSTCFEKCHSNEANDSPGTHQTSNTIERYQQMMATSSCLTVLINDHHQQARNQTVASYPKASPDEFRSVSACGYNWPISCNTQKPAQHAEDSKGSHLRIRSGICCSCSSDTAQDRGGANLVRNHTAGSERRRDFAAVSRIHSANTRQRNHSRARTRSISRFVIEPLAKAWSSLQLSLHQNQQATTTTTTLSNPPAELKTPSSQGAKSTAVTLANQTQQNVGLTFLIHDDDDDNINISESTERDELLVDLNESDIIEDVLQMSSPKRCLVFQGRRMSRSCDVIVETSTTSTSAEPTSSSYYDQNNEQRILLATISQLKSRSRKGGAKQMSFDQHNPRRVDGNQQVSGRPMGTRRLNCTRCRSWSPALLDKLEDCMHHIRNKIPGFSNREGNTIEVNDSRNLNQLTIEQQQEAEAFDPCPEQQPVLSGAMAQVAGAAQFLQESSLQRPLSPSSSSTISTSEPVVDEEDEFNEIGLADWTRNMQRKVPLHCYSKSASRRQKLRQQLSGNSDTLSIQTAGTTLTNVSFDSSSNSPTTVLGSLENAVQHLVSSSVSTSANVVSSDTNDKQTKLGTSDNEH